jgi:YggT family protein
MAFQIVSFLLGVIAGLIGGACLLRAYMQYQRVPFGNPIGRFVFAVTDWLVLPLRKVLPSIRRVDTASVVAAFLIELVHQGLLLAMLGSGLAVLPLVAFLGLLRLAISSLIALVIIYAILSWVRSDSPVTDVVDRLCAPLLRPFRRIIPLVGGIDLSPLALLVVLQVTSMMLG